MSRQSALCSDFVGMVGERVLPTGCRVKTGLSRGKKQLSMRVRGRKPSRVEKQAGEREVGC